MIDVKNIKSGRGAVCLPLKDDDGLIGIGRFFNVKNEDKTILNGFCEKLTHTRLLVVKSTYTPETGDSTCFFKFRLQAWHRVLNGNIPSRQAKHPNCHASDML